MGFQRKDAYTVAVVGATGAVGTEMILTLEQREFPVAELRPLASSRSAGKTRPRPTGPAVRYGANLARPGPLARMSPCPRWIRSARNWPSATETRGSRVSPDSP